jgi:hypothetical protein
MELPGNLKFPPHRRFANKRLKPNIAAGQVPEQDPFKIPDFGLNRFFQGRFYRPSGSRAYFFSAADQKYTPL